MVLEVRAAQTVHFCESAVSWGYAAGRGSAVGCAIATGLNTTEGLEFAAGVLNAPGEAGYPY